MNSFRTGLVSQVFKKLDKDGDGVIRVKISIIFFINLHFSRSMTSKVSTTPNIIQM